MSLPSPRLSTSSFTSGDDLHIYSATDYAYGPQDSNPDLPLSPGLHPSSRRQSLTSSRRSRARASSLFGPPTPLNNDTPFVGTGYDDALNDDDVELEAMETDGEMAMEALGRRKAEERSGYRSSFQKLDGKELAWMAASAVAVGGLTIAAVVVTL
ncbi:hypothetical protein MNV49_003729 [Pseudohyphozyma bogoriensis]|nr:hypothetical protein MNV49_003729 [Pseudohyphozyma bogoriensis]